MKTKLCDVNPAALEKLPEHTGDKSGVGVHYVDAYIKPMNLKLPDGTPVKCKRRGMKVVFSARGKKGEGLVRRLGGRPAAPGRAFGPLRGAGTGAGGRARAVGGAVCAAGWAENQACAVR